MKKSTHEMKKKINIEMLFWYFIPSCFLSIQQLKKKSYTHFKKLKLNSILQNLAV